MTDEELSRAGGLEASWRGTHLRLFGLPTLILLVLSGALAVMIMDNRNAQAKFQAEWDKAVEARKQQALMNIEEHRLRSEEHRQLSEDFKRSMDEVIYVLTLGPDERAELRRRLGVPERLKFRGMTSTP